MHNFKGFTDDLKLGIHVLGYPITKTIKVPVNEGAWQDMTEGPQHPWSQHCI